MTHSSPLLKGPSLKPLSQTSPEHLVIFLHGYGSNGHDLIGLGRAWQKVLRTTEFIAFHAPTPCSESPYEQSYQWFNLSNFDQALMNEGISQTVPLLNASIDKYLEERNLSDHNLALVGFSQGTMMALSAGLARPNPCAGIVGYSGIFIDRPGTPVASLPEILLIHGDHDQVVNIEYLPQSAQRLSSLGAKVRTHICKGLDHTIDNTGLIMGAQFLRESFEKTT
ncbi:MAG: dienelactone hydrolase family protein [Alphaproteobacteria bacterium]|nr:dienelactone hydrolase family protein [Alphaproteobacteria bacterium]